MKVKLFNICYNVAVGNKNSLEDQINDFLEQLKGENREIVDIKYSSSFGANPAGARFIEQSAMVIYK